MAKDSKRGPRGVGWIVLVVVVAVFIGVPISIQIVNDASARHIETQLLDLPLPEGAERTASMAQAGKLDGNGNGMQYLGAILIRSDENVVELKDFYSAQADATGLWLSATPAEDFNGYHGADGFLAHSGESGTFIVSAWGNGPGEFFEVLDIRGH